MGAWTGSGPIVTGSCSTAAWTLFDLSTAYLWAPVIGCLPEKPDCCPSSYVFATMSPAPPGITTDSISISLSTTRTLTLNSETANTTAAASPPQLTATKLVPIQFDPLDPNQPPGAAVLLARDEGTPNSVSVCPEDYDINGATGCCPRGMKPTNDLGIIPVCATQLTNPFPAPRVTITASSPNQPTGLPAEKPISTATDVIYALQYRIYVLEYPTAPKRDSGGGLSRGATAGIAAGCTFFGLVLIGAAVYFLRKKKQDKKKRTTLGSLSGGVGDQYDATMTEKKDNEPVVGGRAELGAEDAAHMQHTMQRYELSATPLSPSQVYQVVRVPQSDQQMTHQPYYQQQQQQQSYGAY